MIRAACAVAWIIGSMLSPSIACAQAWLDLPPVTEMRFSQDEINAHARERWQARQRRDAAAGHAGCRKHCERVGRVFGRLAQAAALLAEAPEPSWHLGVSVDAAEEAWALPGGYVYISEVFIDAFAMDDAQLAFVLAHEIGHVLLRHENQALTIAQALLGHGVRRTVADLYAELDFDMSLTLKLTPEWRAEEFEADRAAMLIGAAAGYAPDALLGFLKLLASRDGGTDAAYARPDDTHPTAADRLARASALLQTATLARQAVLKMAATAPVSVAMP